jgi:hypothetical protein
MKKIECISICFLILSFQFACSNTEQKSNLNTDSSKSTRVLKKIPKRNQTDAFRTLKSKIEEHIGLHSIENGFKTEEMRIWFANSSNKEQLVILRNLEGKWTAELYSLIYNYDLVTNKLVSISKFVQFKIPKSGWQLFISQLFALDISILPDMEEIDNYQIGYDGKTVTIEIANETGYRSYSYWEAYAYQDLIPEAKKVELISKLLEKELDFKRL